MKNIHTQTPQREINITKTTKPNKTPKKQQKKQHTHTHNNNNKQKKQHITKQTKHILKEIQHKMRNTTT